MNKILVSLAVCVLVAGLCWLFPPFHIRSQKSVREAELEQRFDPETYAAQFWADQLLPATAGAADASEVLGVIRSDPQSVRARFGRTVGVSSSYLLFLRGVGEVVQANEDQIELSLSREVPEPEVIIPLGFIFGNAVRDGTGLLDPSDHPNAQEFNDIAVALNSIVETEVLPRLQEIAKVGVTIEFAGCVEINDEEMDLRPLTLVPVRVDVKEP